MKRAVCPVDGNLSGDFSAPGSQPDQGFLSAEMQALAVLQD
jgi:hypothetical protein